MGIFDGYLDRASKKLKDAAQQAVPNTVAPVNNDIAAPVETTTTPVVTPPVTPASQEKTGVQAYLDQTLKGNNPLVQNAQATQNTASAVQKYLAGRNARNTSAQAGFDPGTLQAQRVSDRENAGAEQAILGGQNQVNELTRNVSQQALSDKSSLDSSAIASVKDPKAQNYLQSVLASGGDVQAALAGMYENGVLKPEYSSGTPQQQLRADAENDAEFIYGLTRGTPEFEAFVNDRLQTNDKATTNPLKGAVSEEEKAERIEFASTHGLESLDDAGYEALSSVLTIKSVPNSKVEIEAIVNSKNPFIKTSDGQIYQVIDHLKTTRKNASNGDRANDYAIVMNREGDTVYINGNGEVIPFKPPNAPNGYTITFDPERGTFVGTNNSGVGGKILYDADSGKWGGLK